jgi:hypothetical protein
MEAVLVEGLEPRQNLEQGDDFQAIEFLQVEDAEVCPLRANSCVPCRLPGLPKTKAVFSAPMFSPSHRAASRSELAL